MKYWDIVLDEISQEVQKKKKFSVTNIRDYKKASKQNSDKSDNAPKITKRRKRRYFLGKNFIDIYFTEMEVTTLVYVFYGKTTLEISNILALSRRTIEYYVRNMKKKLHCRYVTVLIRKVLCSDLEKFMRWNDPLCSLFHQHSTVEPLTIEAPKQKET